MTDSQKESAGQFLTFIVGNEEYAIEILRITEIIEFGGATRVPGTPSSVLGVINLRGRVVPVVDLSVKFGSGSTAVTNRSCVVIVEIKLDGENSVMGLLTDAVRQVIDIPSLEPPPPFGTRARIDYLRGIGRSGDRFVIILDIDRLLTSGEADVLSQTVPVTAPAAVAV